MMAQSRLPFEAGIAVGPILFVVAILAIIATAIGASTSTFGVNASQETNRVNAMAMIHIGSTLKLGADRVIGLGAQNNQVTTTGAATQFDIFYINGGSLTYPSVSLASNPASDTWLYTWAPVTNIGTAVVDKVAMLKINQGVCDEINKMINGPVTTTGFAPLPSNWFTGPANMSNWDAGVGAGTLDSKRAGCFQAITNSPGYYFYQILIPQ